MDSGLTWGSNHCSTCTTNMVQLMKNSPEEYPSLRLSATRLQERRAQLIKLTGVGAVPQTQPQQETMFRSHSATNVPCGQGTALCFKHLFPELQCYLAGWCNCQSPQLYPFIQQRQEAAQEKWPPSTDYHQEFMTKGPRGSETCPWPDSATGPDPPHQIQSLRSGPVQRRRAAG